MGTQWLNEAWNAVGIRSSQKLVLLALADHADQNAVCYPSVARIEKYTALGRSTIFQAIGELEELGFITRLKRRARGGANTYRLHFPKVQGVQMLDSPRPDAGPPPVQERDSTRPASGPEPSRTPKEPPVKSARSRGKDQDNVRRAPDDESPVLGADPQHEDSGDGWPVMKLGLKTLTPGSAPYFVEYFSWMWGRQQGRCIWKSSDPLRGYFSRLNKEGYNRDEVRQMIDSFCEDPKHYIGRRRPSSENPPGMMFIGVSLKMLEEIRRSSPSRRDDDDGPGERNLELGRRLLGA